MKVQTAIYIDDIILNQVKALGLNMSSSCETHLKAIVEAMQNPEVKKAQEEIIIKTAELEYSKAALTKLVETIKKRKPIMAFLSTFTHDIEYWIADYNAGQKEEVWQNITLNCPTIKYTKEEVFDALEHMGVVKIAK